jgi:hypothetical protein
MLLVMMLGMGNMVIKETFKIVQRPMFQMGCWCGRWDG